MSLLLGLVLAAAPHGAIAWEPWSPAVFARAAAEKRFVLLDLGAVWCHWCHVMDEVTYGDPDVAALIRERYVAVRVDQEAEPELAHRYEDYGWPATIVFNPDGSEIVRRRGYMPPVGMLAMLREIVEDPSPGPSVTAPEVVVPAASGEALARRLPALLARWRARFDREHAGFGDLHQLVDADDIEVALRLAASGDRAAATMAKRTLDANLALLDPVFGGAYQYSDERDWSSPHYEKIMWTQAANLRAYAMGHAAFGDPKYLAAARGIAAYLSRYLSSPEGVFYTSQDADLSREVPGKRYYALDEAARLALGLPRIDRHVYTRENGWAIRGLAELGETAAAVRAAEWMLAHRKLEGGGFTRTSSAGGKLYLGDTLAMGEALLALHRATGEARFREEALSALAFIEARFTDAAGGFATSTGDLVTLGALRPAVKQIDEQIGVARLALALDRRAVADHAARWLGAKAVDGWLRSIAGRTLAAMDYRPFRYSSRSARSAALKTSPKVWPPLP